jgi:sec-independent protein translocase protein TatC
LEDGSEESSGEAGAEELDRMTLLEHLEELRRRLLSSVLAMFVGFMACFAFAKPIYRVLAMPITGGAIPLPSIPRLNGWLGARELPLLPHEIAFEALVEKLSFLKITDPFVLYVKVALLASVFLVSPFILYQVWGFIRPGLYRRERRYAAPFIVFGSSFFLAGGLFGYLVAFPFAARFLINMGGEFEAVITVDTYLGLLTNVLLGLGVMFQLPILIFMLAQLGVVTPRFLLKHFRWAVLLIFLVSAIITPTPDVVNLMVVAVPTIVLYLLGVGAAALADWRKRRRAKSRGAA